MDKTQEELLKALEQAQQGNWLPIAIVSVTFGVVISLLIYIWNQSSKSNEKRHEKSEELIAELTKNSTEQRILLERLNTMIAVHEGVLSKGK